MAPSQPPFLKEHQINEELGAVKTLNGQVTQVSTRGEDSATLPGHPHIIMQDSDGLLELLVRELCTPQLDTLSPHLWLVATQDSNHVSALHHQIVRGRSIIISEDPGLHLLWIDDRVYIKPIPAYLLSHAFWIFLLSEHYSPGFCHSRDNLSRSARGFLRTYTHLIAHESDFQLAKTHSLIPAEVNWKAWSLFSASLRENITNADVSPRYHFGELRLSRLNFWSKVFLRRKHYFKARGQTAAYLASFFAPLVYVWATINVILAAMQLELSVQQVYGPGEGSHGDWAAFAAVGRWFSVAILFIAVLAIAFLSMLISGRYLEELRFALKDLARRRKKLKVKDIEGQLSQKLRI